MNTNKLTNRFVISVNGIKNKTTNEFVNKKGERFIARTSQDLLASYSVSDRPKLEDTLSVSKFLIGQYENENFHV